VLLATATTGRGDSSPGISPKCPTGQITNSAPPTLAPSGTVQVGTQLTASYYGGWASCGEGIDNYQWQFQRDDGSVTASCNAQRGCAAPSYTTQSADQGHTIWLYVAACNLDGCYAPEVQSSNSASVSSGGGGGCSTGSSMPEVDSFDPAGSASGEEVYLTGSGFTGACSVQFDGTSASYTVVDDSGIDATVPSGAGEGPITVTNQMGTATSFMPYYAHGARPMGTVSEMATPDYVKFANDNGTYWIGLRCSPLTESVAGWKEKGTSAGPGYISRMLRRTDATNMNTVTTVESPNDPSLLNSDLQGVGVFGVHLATGSARGTGPTSTGIANGNVCTSDIPTMNANGVQTLGAVSRVTSTPLIPPHKLSSTEWEVGVEATITTSYPGAGGNIDMFDVKYITRVNPDVVYQWTTVTNLCNSACGGPTWSIKEPKIVVTLNGESVDPTKEYTRVSCWDNTTQWTTPLSGTISNNPASATSNCGDATGGTNRMRTLFDYASSGNAAASPSGCPNNAPTALKTCFVVASESFIPNGSPYGPGQQLYLWSNAGQGFEKWAMDADADYRSDWKACSSGTRPAQAAVHRFEQAGHTPNNHRVKSNGSIEQTNEREAILMAWAGGSGPSDCQSLYAGLPSTKTSYGEFNAYSFGPGWKDNLVNPS
jgi:hypothetical protein